MICCIVGGAGAMGKWFAKELRDYDVFDELILLDKDKETAKEVAEELDIGFCESNEVLREADVVVVSVPIDAFSRVIEEISDFVSSGSLVIDVCSVKEKPVEVMKEHLSKDVLKLGAHPLFGPNESDLRDQNVVLVPIDNDAFVCVRDFLVNNGANVIEMSAGKHDEAMAVVQGLNHLLMISLGNYLNEIDFDVSNYLTPSFKELMKNVERIREQNPELYASIQLNNKYTITRAEEFKERLNEAIDLVSEEKRKELIEFIKNI